MNATLPQALEPFREELSTYYKELPRLLEESCEGKYVVIKGNEIHGIWDTLSDARQYGYLRFELVPFLSQKVDSRFLEMLEPLFGKAPIPQLEEVA